MTWSLSPDRTWSDLNRVLSYALIATIGVIAGAGIPRAAERLAAGFLGVAGIVALYALAGKVAPGLLDDTEQVARLRAPLEYWNALGLLCVLAAPVALRLAIDRGRGRLARILAIEGLLVLTIVLGLTYSRGGVAAFVVAAVVVTLLGGSDRLRGVLALALTLLAAAGPLAFAFMRDALTVNGAPLEDRIADGRLLGLLIALAAVALYRAADILMRREPRVSWSPARTVRIAVSAGLAALVGLAGLALSQRGSLEGITEVREDRPDDPVRLLSANSGTRVAWWNEAAGAWSDRPVHGWGGGTFALLHLRYRKDTLPVTQAHSVPLQVLSETGAVGLVLLYGAILALLAAALARLRSTAREERGMQAAMIAAAAAWLLHGLYDWDLQIPAVTAPVFLMLGLLAAAPPRRDPQRAAMEAIAPPRLESRGPLVALATLAAAAVVASAALPWLSARMAATAGAAAGDTPQALEEAARQADLAARLNPVAVRPLFVASAIAVRRDRQLEARAHLLEAADRAPADPQVWQRLAALALQLADRRGYLEASRRLLELDPRNPFAEAQLARALLILTLPGSSATATGTPLVRP